MADLTASQKQDFSNYVAESWKRLHYRAFRICRDWEHASDLVQSALLAAYKYWGRLEGVVNRDAYVTKIMLRLYLREIQPTLSAEILMDELPEEATATILEAELVDERITLTAALSRLGTRQRMVIMLRFMADLQVEEAARILMCGPSTVRSQSTRALNTLRHIMS